MLPSTKKASSPNHVLLGQDALSPEGLSDPLG